MASSTQSPQTGQKSILDQGSPTSTDEKKVLVKDLLEGSHYQQQVLAVEEIQQHTTRSGKPYYRLRLQDRSGELPAKIWEDKFSQCQDLDSLQRGDVVRADFAVDSYDNKIQLIISRLEKTEDYDLGVLTQVATREVEDMWQQALEVIDSIKDSDYQKVLQNIFQDEVVASKIKYAPAAEKVHHDFVGGLLEHTLEMVDLAEVILRLYPKADRDTVLTGVLIHDLGKIYELARDKAIFVRTQKGYLIGHITLGVELLLNHLPANFPEDKKDHLIHILLSHHGEKEKGAVLVPATIEASIVSYADLVSSQVHLFDKELQEGNPDDSGFGEFHRFLRTRIWHLQGGKDSTFTEGKKEKDAKKED